MTNRTRFLLLSLGCWAVCGALLEFGLAGTAHGDRGGARLLTAFIWLFGVGGIYFLIAAFSKRRHRFGHNYNEYTTFFCPTCKTKLDYSQFPAVTDEMRCPKCGQPLTQRKTSAGFQFRFVRSPEVRCDLSSEGDSPPSGSVTPEAIRQALAARAGFTVEDDPDGWLVLTSTVGPPRWADGPTPGAVVAAKHVARLSLRPAEGDASTIRPESLSLISTEVNLSVNVCLALSSAFGSLRVRIHGADEWIAVNATGGELLAQLARQHLRVKPVSGLLG